MTQRQTPASAVGGVVTEMFGSGFFVGDALREEVRAEAAVRLAYAMRRDGVHPDSVRALAQAIREMAEAAPLQDMEKEPLTAGQRKLLHGLIAEMTLPVAFRTLLEAALPKVTMRRDLVALQGMLSSTYERMGRIEAVRAMPAEVPAPKR
ncbi:hypothetical protein [Hyalangium gracile]|uniref:hypothetical protein n=1 Tax=Hyalangium gracile TaxID=394092 RepID=UPI001CCD021D|nr:hypothetical protein [Hyalangium gracile]